METKTTLSFPFAIGDNVAVSKYGITGYVKGLGMFKGDATVEIDVEYVDKNGEVKTRWFFADEVSSVSA
jgi:hypothetical protein